MLARWEENLGAPIANHFDLITGTSTGGIIALGLGLGLRPREIVQFYLIILLVAHATLGDVAVTSLRLPASNESDKRHPQRHGRRHSAGSRQIHGGRKPRIGILHLLPRLLLNLLRVLSAPFSQIIGINSAGIASATQQIINHRPLQQNVSQKDLNSRSGHFQRLNQLGVFLIHVECSESVSPPCFTPNVFSRRS